MQHLNGNIVTEVTVHSLTYITEQDLSALGE